MHQRHALSDNQDLRVHRRDSTERDLINTVLLSPQALAYFGLTDAPPRIDLDGWAGVLAGMDLDGAYVYRKA